MEDNYYSQKFSAQRQLIYNYLKNYGSITQIEAINDLGCLRLGARIWELRHDYNLPITTHHEMSVNRYGRKVSYARYVLEEGKEEDKRESLAEESLD